MNQRNASHQQPQCPSTNAASTSAMIHSQGPMVGNVPTNAQLFYTPIQNDGYGPQMFQYGFPYGEGVYQQADLYAAQGGIPQQISTFNLPRGSVPTNGQNEFVQMNGFVAAQGPSSQDAAMGNYLPLQNRRIGNEHAVSAANGGQKYVQHMSAGFPKQQQLFYAANAAENAARNHPDPRSRFSSMFDNGADNYTASWVSSTSSIPPDLKVPPDSSGPNTPSGMEYPSWGGGDMPAMVNHPNIRRESSVDEFAAGASATSGFSPPSEMNLEGVMGNLNLGNQIHAGRMQNFPISNNTAVPPARRVQRDETWADIARRGVDRSETNNPLPISVAPPHMISPASQMRQTNQIQGGQLPPANQPLMRNMASMPYRQMVHDPRRNNGPHENAHEVDSGSSRSAFGLNAACHGARYDRGQPQFRGGSRRSNNSQRSSTENRGQFQRRAVNEPGRRFQRSNEFHQNRAAHSGGIQYSPDAPADPSSGHHNKTEASSRAGSNSHQTTTTHAFTSGCQGTGFSHSQPQSLFIPPNNSFVPPLLQSQMPFGVPQQFVTMPNPMAMNNFVPPMAQPQSGQQPSNDHNNYSSQQLQPVMPIPPFNSPHPLPLPFMSRTFPHGQAFPGQPPFMPFSLIHNEMFAHGMPPPFFNPGMPMLEALPNPLFPRDHQATSPQRDRFRDTWLDQNARPPEQTAVEMQLIPRAAMHNNAIEYARDKGIPLNAFAGSLLHTTRAATNRPEHPERGNRNRASRGRGGFRASGQKNDSSKGKEEKQ